MILVINYANDVFKYAQQYSTKTAYKVGQADRVISFSPEDIDEDFRHRFKHILSIARGNGCWLWKPYFVNRVLNEVAKNDDYVLYLDSRSYFVNRIDLLIKEMERANADIMTFETCYLERQYTKRSTMIKMGCDNVDIANSNQILGGCILLKKSIYSVNFAAQWLAYACTDKIITDEEDEENYPEFIDHRHDQSILSLLCKKEQIIPFRDPSQWSDRPFPLCRLPVNRLIRIPQHTNSNYPRIIALTRALTKKGIYKFKIRLWIDDMLEKCHFSRM